MPDAMAEVVAFHSEQLTVSVKLLKRAYIATVDGNIWLFPEPTLRVNEIFKLSPIDFAGDDYAVAKLFYLLENRKNGDVLGQFTTGDDGSDVFVWPTEQHLQSQRILTGFGKDDYIKFIDLTCSDLVEIYVGWVQSLDAQAKVQPTKILKHKLGLKSPDINEIAWSLIEATGLSVDAALDLTAGELIALADGSESALKRSEERRKRK